MNGRTSDSFLWDTDLIDPGGVLLKLSSSGGLIWWSNTYTPESWSSYRVFDILADSKGIISTGIFSYPLFIADSVFDTNGSGVDALLIKHKVDAGQIEWVKQIGLPRSSDENIYKLSRGPSGSIYGVGRFDHNVTLLDTILLLNPVPGLNTLFFVKLSTEDFFSDPKSELNNWAIFPNPADDYFCVQGEWTNSPVTIDLFDIQGKRIYQNEALPSSQDELLNFPLPSVLTSGVYILTLSHDGLRRSFKLMIH